MQFKATTLEALCSFKAGTAFKKNLQGKTSGEYPFIKVSDMNLPNNSFYIKEANNWVDSTDLPKIENKLHPAHATVFAKIGEALKANRRRLLTNPTLVDNNMMSATAKKRTDPFFLYYLLTNIDFNLYYDGSALPYLNVSTLNNIDISVPDNKTDQRKISNFLLGIDNKIELNRQMCETLEQTAATLFKSWFVDFDPVKAKRAGRVLEGMSPALLDLFPDSFEESELGEIPAGWGVGTYGDAMSIYDSMRVPLSKSQREKKQGEFPYYGATSCMDYVDEYLFDGVYLLMGEDGSVAHENGTPFLQYVWGKFWVNNHAHILQGKNGFSTEHLFCGLSSANVAPYVTGAVQPKLNQANMKRIPLVVPNQPILSAFSDIIFPFFDKRRSKIEENKTLAELRDSLLPKLISGELRVADAQREMEEAV